MNTKPSIDDLLEAVIMGIDDDILPELSNPKSQATAVMMQSVLQGVRQLLPAYDSVLVEETNESIEKLGEIAGTIGEVTGEAADRIRERASRLGQREPLPPPPDRAELMAAHRELTEGLAAMLPDLDELIRGGVAEADHALQILRGYLGPRYVRDVARFTVGEGLLGRG